MYVIHLHLSAGQLKLFLTYLLTNYFNAKAITKHRNQITNTITYITNLE